MTGHDTEFRFSWFIGFAVLLHVALFWWFSVFTSRQKEALPVEHHVRVNLNAMAPSLPEARMSSPAPAQAVPVPKPQILPDVAPLRTTPIPRRVEPAAARPVRVVQKKSPTMSSPLLDGPAVEPVRRTNAAGSPAEAQASASAPAAGRTTDAGNTAGAGTSMASAGKPHEAQDFGDYLSSIRSMIEERKRYPLVSRRMRQEGSVKIRFIVGKDGRLHGEPAITTPSRHPALDRAAVESVTAAAPFPPIPKALGVETLNLNLVIVFNLTE